MTTVKHSGDVGDIIYFMPVLKSYADTVGKVTLFLDPNQAKETGMLTRQSMNFVNAAPLRPLLGSQDYIGSVMPYTGQEVEVDGDSWRRTMLRMLKNPETFEASKKITLCAWQRNRHGVGYEYEDNRWIDNIEPHRQSPQIVINRSARYHNDRFPWSLIADKWHDMIEFVGLRSEWEDFCSKFGHVRYRPTETFLDVARLIKGSRLFIGNQSACYAVAEGMKHNAVIEVFPQMPNCCFIRDNVIHGWGQETFHMIRTKFNLQ